MKTRKRPTLTAADLAGSIDVVDTVLASGQIRDSGGERLYVTAQLRVEHLDDGEREQLVSLANQLTPGTTLGEMKRAAEHSRVRLAPVIERQAAAIEHGGAEGTLDTDAATAAATALRERGVPLDDSQLVPFLTQLRDGGAELPPPRPRPRERRMPDIDRLTSEEQQMLRDLITKMNGGTDPVAKADHQRRMGRLAARARVKPLPTPQVASPGDVVIPCQLFDLLRKNGVGPDGRDWRYTQLADVAVYGLIADALTRREPLNPRVARVDGEGPDATLIVAAGRKPWLVIHDEDEALTGKDFEASLKSLQHAQLITLDTVGGSYRIKLKVAS